MEEERLASAVAFLTNPKVVDIRTQQKVQFLQSKGLSPAEIAEAQRQADALAPPPPTAASSAATAVAVPQESWWRTLLMRALSGTIFAGVGAAAAFWLQRRLYPRAPRFPLFPSVPGGGAAQTNPWAAAQQQQAERDGLGSALVPSSGVAAASTSADVEALQQLVQLLQETMEAQATATRKTVKALAERVEAAERATKTRAAAAANATDRGMLAELSSIKTLLLAANVKRGKEEGATSEGADGDAATVESSAASAADDGRLTLAELKEAASALQVVGASIPAATTAAAAAADAADAAAAEVSLFIYRHISCESCSQFDSPPHICYFNFVMFKSLPTEEEAQRAELKARMDASRSRDATRRARAERIAAAVRALDEESAATPEARDALRSGLQMFVMYISNLSQNPLNPRYRKIPVDSPSFKEKCAVLGGANEFLESVGFKLVRPRPFTLPPSASACASSFDLHMCAAPPSSRSYPLPPPHARTPLPPTRPACPRRAARQALHLDVGRREQRRDGRDADLAEDMPRAAAGVERQGSNRPRCGGAAWCCGSGG